MQFKLCGVLRFVGLLVVAVTVAGCNGSDHYHVNGTVTLDGDPVTAGRVLFVPTESGRTAVGAIQSDGSFSLTTDGVTGARAGHYQVAVRPPGSAVSEESMPVAIESNIPTRYGNVATSDLTCVVDSSSSDGVQLTLTTKGE